MSTHARARVSDDTLPWAVYRTSCLEMPLGMPALADKTVNHVIADPPYEIEAHTRSMRSKPGRGGIERMRIPYDPMSQALRDDFSREAVRICRGWILVFCQVEAVAAWRAALEQAGAVWRRGMVWVKPDSTPQFQGDRPGQAFECIAAAWAGPGRSKWNARGKRGIYVHNANEGGKRRPHPNAKPVALMESLISDFTQPGDIIADPFCGAGSTGIAAVRLGRRFIGWELDGVYSERASRRLRGTREQLDMFTARSRRRPLPKQMRLRDVA